MTNDVPCDFLKTEYGLVEIDTDPTRKCLSHRSILFRNFLIGIFSISFHDFSFCKYETFDNKK